MADGNTSATGHGRRGRHRHAAMAASSGKTPLAQLPPPCDQSMDPAARACWAHAAKFSEGCEKYDMCKCSDSKKHCRFPRTQQDPVQTTFREQGEPQLRDPEEQDRQARFARARPPDTRSKGSARHKRRLGRRQSYDPPPQSNLPKLSASLVWKVKGQAGTLAQNALNAPELVLAPRLRVGPRAVAAVSQPLASTQQHARCVVLSVFEQHNQDILYLVLCHAAGWDPENHHQLCGQSCLCCRALAGEAFGYGEACADMYYVKMVSQSWRAMVLKIGHPTAD